MAEYGYLRTNGPTVSIPQDLSFSSDGTAAAASLASSLNLMIYEKLLQLPEAEATTATYASAPYVERAFYHNVHGNVLQIVERNVIGGISRTSAKYDRDGKVEEILESVTTSPSSQPTEKLTIYSYDNRGRLLNEDVQMDGAATVSTSYTYDILGRQASVSGNGLSQTYRYNFQGWLSGINASAGASPVFRETLRYADAIYTSRLHNGTISEVTWQHGSGTTATYAYSYDGAGRLVGTNHYTGSVRDDLWTETGISYDENGNMTGITRHAASGTSPVDNLNLKYSDNTLVSVNGASFSYNASGAISYDPLRELTFSYNAIGAPTSIRSNSDAAFYSYLSDGTKVFVLGERNEDGYAYLGSMIFRLCEGDWIIDSTPFSEGQIHRIEDRWIADRFVTDHLGSVRAVVRDGQVVERNDYYPYGGRHDNPSLPIDKENRWGFCAKEIQTTAGIDLLDFGARLYDPSIARWNAPDPLADYSPSISAYAYCAGNPVNLIDPSGCLITDYFTKGGKHYYHQTDDLNDQYIILSKVNKKETDEEKKKDAVADAWKKHEIVPVISKDALNNMNKTFRLTLKDGKEHMFSVGVKGSVTTITSGTDDSVSTEIPHKELYDKGEDLAFDVHSHPANQSGDSTIPSKNDLVNVVGKKLNAVLGFEVIYVPAFNSYTSGAESKPGSRSIKKIYFYDKTLSEQDIKNHTPVRYRMYRRINKRTLRKNK